MNCDECHTWTTETREPKNTPIHVCATCVGQRYCNSCMEHVNVCGERVTRNGELYCMDCANNIIEQVITEAEADLIFELYMAAFPPIYNIIYNNIIYDNIIN